LDRKVKQKDLQGAPDGRTIDENSSGKSENSQYVTSPKKCSETKGSLPTQLKNTERGTRIRQVGQKYEKKLVGRVKKREKKKNGGITVH